MDQGAEVAGDAFVGFPKVPRLVRDCTITEKIDGTNAQVFIRPATSPMIFGLDTQIIVDGCPAYIRAGSRNRYLTNGGGKEDNMGFGAWVYQHAHELAALGFGRHYGEWWGQGIQRNYGLTEKRFSLFNVGRWSAENTPACCHIVPVLATFTFDSGFIDTIVMKLATEGSLAAPGFMQPEGVMVFHHASGQMFKRLIENDDMPKSLAA